MDKGIYEQVFGWLFVVVLFAVIVGLIYLANHHANDKNRMCAEQTGTTFDWKDGSPPNTMYENFDDYHYACCFYEKSVRPDDVTKTYYEKNCVIFDKVE